MRGAQGLSPCGKGIGFPNGARTNRKGKGWQEALSLLVCANKAGREPRGRRRTERESAGVQLLRGESADRRRAAAENKGGKFIRTNSIKLEAWAVLEKLLMPENALVIETMLQTGLRVSDVLNLRTATLRKGQRFTVTESKTGKGKRVRIGNALYLRLLAQCGKIYVFPSTRTELKHRTRQAVWADVKRAAKALRMRVNVAPHSARKSYAVGEYQRTHDIEAVKRKLNHSNIETTILYLLDIIFETGGAERRPTEEGGG